MASQIHLTNAGNGTLRIKFQDIVTDDKTKKPIAGRFKPSTQPDVLVQRQGTRDNMGFKDRLDLYVDGSRRIIIEEIPA